LGPWELIATGNAVLTISKEIPSTAKDVPGITGGTERSSDTPNRFSQLSAIAIHIPVFNLKEHLVSETIPIECIVPGAVVAAKTVECDAVVTLKSHGISPESILSKRVD
jgi:hypothetical protein